MHPFCNQLPYGFAGYFRDARVNIGLVFDISDITILDASGNVAATSNTGTFLYSQRPYGDNMTVNSENSNVMLPIVSGQKYTVRFKRSDGVSQSKRMTAKTDASPGTVSRLTFYWEEPWQF